MIKYFIGPMSKNIVDAVMEYSSEKQIKFGFIPSRRQVAFDGGYVNNWNTQQFRKYVGNFFIVRDHAGPNQGKIEDDGYESLKHDCNNMNVIHIDPWKKYKDFNDGVDNTIKMIQYCYKINPTLNYEIATEQSIRNFTPTELETLLQTLEKRLKTDEFEMIKYCVIQSGTSLENNTNTGNYDQNRLIEMIKVAKKFQLLSKEHNGDYLPTSLIKQKFDLGLDCINIAPEFGQIETKTYLQCINNDQQLINTYWKICYNSKKWTKWVNESFNPYENKVELINICGHYVLSNENFLNNIKNKFPNIDDKIKLNIKNKLDDLVDG